MKQINIRLNDRQVELLETSGTKLGLTTSELVRYLINKYIEQEMKKNEQKPTLRQ